MQRFAAVFAIISVLVLSAERAKADPPTILVDGVTAQTDVPPIVEDGHVLVPLRGVFERFGASVDYDAASNAAVIRRGAVSAKVVVDSPVAWVNGGRVALESPARELGGRIEVPLRFVAEALGVSVDYDAGSNTVVVVSGFHPGNFVAAGAGTPPYVSGRLPSAQASVAEMPTVEDQRPTPDQLIGTQYPQIYARLGGGSSPVDPATVRVLVDSVDVTDSATVSSAYIAYTPSSAMTDGSHTVDVSGQTEDGVPFDSQWSFRIESDVSSSYVSSMVGFSPSPFGVPRFGFFPPGFSVFAPGPQFFFEDEPIIIVFFSPFFPNGFGFFTLSGFPGQFAMTPWLGCPGFFWGSLNVPQGVIDPRAIVVAHFSTSDGRTVVVHSTAPLHIDGTRKSPPASMRFAVRAHLVDHAMTPRKLVAFHRVIPAEAIDRRGMPIVMREDRRVPIVMRNTRGVPIEIFRRSPSVPVARPIPVAPRMPPPIPVVPRPQVPREPVPIIIPRMPQPVPIPHKPPA